jgi:hypothetical protein
LHKIARIEAETDHLDRFLGNRGVGARVLLPSMRRDVMRVLIGIILGALMTIIGAYVYDSHTASANAQAGVQRPLVNWDVVATKWDRLTERTRH